MMKLLACHELDEGWNFPSSSAGEVHVARIDLAYRTRTFFYSVLLLAVFHQLRIVLLDPELEPGDVSRL